MSIIVFSDLIIARYKEGYGVKVLSRREENHATPVYEHIVQFNEHIIAVQVTASFRRIRQRLLNMPRHS